VLIVANHSGMGTAELCSLLMAWYERFGTSRPVAGMAHPAAFRVPVLREALVGLGAVEATRAGAAEARWARVPILVFPGGDHEAARPAWRADEVDFAGRTGWVRLARDHGLDIVPLCITGSHNTLPILARGRAISWATGLRLLGVHRAPLPVLSVASVGLSMAITSALGFSPVFRLLSAWSSYWATMMIPWIPSRIGFHLLPAIAAERVARSKDAAIYDEVVSSLGATLRAQNAAVRSPGPV